MVSEANKDEPVQLGEADFVLRADLAEFDDSLEARRLRERLADLELLDRLALEGYDGPDYIALAEDLARYGVTVIRSWCLNSIIFKQCADKGRPINRRRIDYDLAVELAGETVSLALKRFKQYVLIPRKWSPDKGASLETYFIGQCVLRFPTVYRRHFRPEDEEMRFRDRRPVDIDLSDGAPTPDNEVMNRMEVQAALAEIEDPKMRCILTHLADDMPYAEIATACGLTESGVKNRIYRMNKERKVG